LKGQSASKFERVEQTEPIIIAEAVAQRPQNRHHQECGDGFSNRDDDEHRHHRVLAGLRASLVYRRSGAVARSAGIAPSVLIATLPQDNLAATFRPTECQTAPV
jgi:hypothetical protein